MDGILLFLEAISNFFGIFGATSDFISGNWYFGQSLADFFAWLIEFFGGLFG